MQAIKDKFDSLITDITALLDTGKQLEDDKKQQEEFDHRLRNRVKELDEKNRQYELKLEDLEKERRYIDKKSEEIAQKEVVLERIEAKKQELIKQEEVTDEKIAINKKLLTQLDEKLKAIEILNLRETELDHREALLKKEMLVDRGRKEELEKKTKYLDVKQERLQKEADKITEYAK